MINNYIKYSLFNCFFIFNILLFTMEQKQFSDSKRTKSKLQKLFDEIEEEEK